MVTSLALGLLLRFGGVQTPSWQDLQSHYASTPLTEQSSSSERSNSDNITRIKFTFPGTVSDTVQGDLVEPAGTGPFPCVLLLHGLTSGKSVMEASFGPALLELGIAYAAIDAPHHGTRQTEADKKLFGQMMTAVFSSGVQGDLAKAVIMSDKTGQARMFLMEAVGKGLLDERHALDFFAKRPEINSRKIGLIGVSMGSIMGTILAAVDNRVSAAALCVGGDPVLPLIGHMPPFPESFHMDIAKESAYLSPSLYAPHVNVPVHMLSGRKDTIIPKDATDRLYNAFPRTSSSIEWYDTDHYLNSTAFGNAVSWIAKSLK